ncbi:MAG: sugar phosphate isomerase/epimerase family protein [Christensenellales bacterium]|jgi:sugar phosphate isomerase/epimerase
MRIGISSWSYPYAIGNKAYDFPAHPMGLLTLANKAVVHGADVLQVADNLPVHAASHEELLQLRNLARQHHLYLEVGTAGLEPDNLLKYLDIAQMLGAKLVRTLPHAGQDIPNLDVAQQRVDQLLGKFVGAGIVLGIENHDHYPSEWIRKLIDTFKDPFLGVCLDAVNNLGLGESFREVVDTLGPVTVNFHCKDYTIHRKPSMLGFDVEGAIAGEGFLDLELAKRVLPPDISWVLESWMPWQGNIEKTVSMEEEWVIKGLDNLRAFRTQKTAKAAGAKE